MKWEIDLRLFNMWVVDFECRHSNKNKKHFNFCSQCVSEHTNQPPITIEFARPSRSNVDGASISHCGERIHYLVPIAFQVSKYIRYIRRIHIKIAGFLRYAIRITAQSQQTRSWESRPRGRRGRKSREALEFAQLRHPDSWHQICERTCRHITHSQYVLVTFVIAIQHRLQVKRDHRRRLIKRTDARHRRVILDTHKI